MGLNEDTVYLLEIDHAELVPHGFDERTQTETDQRFDHVGFRIVLASGVNNLRDWVDTSHTWT